MLLETDKCGMLTLVRKLTVEDFKLKETPPVVSEAWHGSFTVSQRATLVNPERFTQDELKVTLSNGYDNKIDTEIRLEKRVEVSLKGVRKEKQDAKVQATKTRELGEFCDLSQQMSALANRVEKMNKLLEEHVTSTNNNTRYKLINQYRDLNAWQYKGDDLTALNKEYTAAITKLRAVSKQIRELKETELQKLVETTDKLTPELRAEIKARIDKDGFIDNSFNPV